MTDGTESASRCLFNRAGLFTLVEDPERDLREIRIPVGNRMIDYDEFYRLTDRQFAAFVEDPHEAKAFADQCRRREHDDLLRLAPGTDRGTPWIPDESAESLSTIMFYDATTSAPAGYALGFQARTHARYLSIPREPGQVHGIWEHFEISPGEFARMTSDAAAAVRFAAECRAGDHHDSRIPPDDRTTVTRPALDDAAERARVFLSDQLGTSADVVILVDHAVESADSWFFPWNGRRWVQYGEFSAAYAGNHPVKIMKADGTASFAIPGEW